MISKTIKKKSIKTKMSTNRINVEKEERLKKASEKLRSISEKLRITSEQLIQASEKLR